MADIFVTILIGILMGCGVIILGACCYSIIYSLYSMIKNTFTNIKDLKDEENNNGTK